MRPGCERPEQRQPDGRSPCGRAQFIERFPMDSRWLWSHGLEYPDRRTYKAFSSEVDTGSREENASNQK
jgi:hypothetical protein